MIANTLAGYCLVAAYCLPLACLVVGGVIHATRKGRK